MRKLFYILFIGFNFLACSQEKKTEPKKQEITYDINKYTPSECKNITKDNYVEKVLESIKYYDKEPIYYFRINKQNCLIEVFINDVIDHRDYELANTITPIEVGHILRSGRQEVTVKMYPVGDLINQDLGLENQPPSTKLSDKAQVNIEIVMIDEKSKKSFSDEIKITEKVSPKGVAGKTFYEFSFTFDANVPYIFEGWSKGQDLRKLDQVLVRKKAEEFYKIVGQIHTEKDLDSWLKLNYQSDLRIKQSFYKSKDDIKSTLAEYNDDVLSADYKVQISQNYNLTYMGDGKLLKLQQSSLEDTYRGKGALLLESEESYYFPGITLYLPEGRDLATQGFMMWK